MQEIPAVLLLCDFILIFSNALLPSAFREIHVYYQLNATTARRIYIAKILLAWMAAIAASALPVLMAVNASTF